jgi:hypothetical protein
MSEFLVCTFERKFKEEFSNRINMRKLNFQCETVFYLELRCSSEEYPVKNDIFVIILVKICMGKICFTVADANILFNLLD